jgi:hypothetical protein
MKYGMTFFLALLFSVTPLASEKQHISSSELLLGGISIGQSENSVIKHLGKPIARSNTGEGYKLSYKGIDVYVGAGQYGVFDLTSTSRAYCTPSHICPGMPVSSLDSMFGPAVVAERENGKFLEYTPLESTCWLQIRENKGIIESLRIACQP